jgi:hypothetical protein
MTARFPSALPLVAAGLLTLTSCGREKAADAPPRPAQPAVRDPSAPAPGTQAAEAIGLDPSPPSPGR